MIPPISHLALAATVLSSSVLVGALSPSDISPDTPTSSLLSSAQAHLSRGETTEALVYYDAAIAKNPSDYITVFKRATTYLSQGRTSQATQDFQTVLTLKPGFEGAHHQLGKLSARHADWDTALDHYTRAALADDNPDRARLLAAQEAAQKAHAHAADSAWEACTEHAGDAILLADRALDLRHLRIKCAWEIGHVQKPLKDLQQVLHMNPGDTKPHMQISAALYYGLADREKGLATIKRCLHSDPESKPCKKLLKQEKNIEKALTKIDKALAKKQYMTGVKLLVPSTNGETQGLIKDVEQEVVNLKADGLLPENAPVALLSTMFELACRAYYEANGKKAETYCTEALKLKEDSLWGMLHKAKKLLAAEEWDAAISLIKEASEAHPENKANTKPLMDEAQIGLKRSKTKDYYKVLGVDRQADDRQIKSAYRKASKLNHPDKVAKRGVSKEEAEKKMASINEAYEVLSDPELRRRFDMGDDPNDQSGGGGGGHGGNPFANFQGAFQGFQGFDFGGGGGGGGPQFKFKTGGGGGGGNPFGGFQGFPF